MDVLLSPGWGEGDHKNAASNLKIEMLEERVSIVQADVGGPKLIAWVERMEAHSAL